MSDILINIADVRHRSEANGPGLRSVVWVQGCSRYCPGCFNPHTHPHEAVKLLDPEELGRHLAGIADTVGITISGGEPFEQAAACAVLAETVRAAGKTVTVFSGCPFEQLKESPAPAIQRFLRSIDLIVAGPYLQELACESKLWRASSNQTVHFLTENEADADTDAATPVMEVRTDGQQLSFTGFPESEDLTWFDRLSAALNSVGSPVNP